MGKAFNILVAAALAVGLVYFAYQTFRSDESILRDQVLELMDSFNDRKARSCVDPLAESFQVKSFGYTKEQVRQGLVYLFTKKRSVSGRFPYRVVIAEHKIEIVLERPDRDTGTLYFNGQLLNVSTEAERLEWDFEAFTEVAKVDGKWKFMDVELKTVSGTRPF